MPYLSETIINHRRVVTTAADDNVAETDFITKRYDTKWKISSGLSL